MEAITRAIREELAEIEIHPQKVAGRENARWVLLDYADLIIHVFQQDERDYYELDRLWADASEVEVAKGKSEEEIINEG